MNLLLLFMFLVQSLLRGPIGALLHPALLHLLIPALLHTATSYGKGGGGKVARRRREMQSLSMS